MRTWPEQTIRPVSETIKNLKKPAESDLLIHIEMRLFLEPPQSTKQLSHYQVLPQTLGSCTCNSTETGDNRPHISCILILVRMQTSWKWANDSTQTLQKDHEFWHIGACFMVASRPRCPWLTKCVRTCLLMANNTPVWPFAIAYIKRVTC